MYRHFVSFRCPIATATSCNTEIPRLPVVIKCADIMCIYSIFIVDIYVAMNWKSLVRNLQVVEVYSYSEESKFCFSTCLSVALLKKIAKKFCWNLLEGLVMAQGIRWSFYSFMRSGDAYEIAAVLSFVFTRWQHCPRHRCEISDHFWLRNTSALRAVMLPIPWCAPTQSRSCEQLA